MLFIVLYIPLCAGIMYAAYHLLQGKKDLLRWVLKGVSKLFGAAFLFSLILAGFMLIIISSWWYYSQQAGLFYFGLALFQTYFVSMFFVSQLYTIPLIIQEDLTLLRAMGQSIRLFVANPLYSIGAGFQALCIFLVLGVTVVGFACLFVGMMSIYLNLLTFNIRSSQHSKELEHTLLLAHG